MGGSRHVTCRAIAIAGHVFMLEISLFLWNCQRRASVLTRFVAPDTMRSGASAVELEHRLCAEDRESSIMMNPTQANSWEHLQQAIDAEIKSLEESLSALKRCRNVLSTISSLQHPFSIVAIDIASTFLNQ